MIKIIGNEIWRGAEKLGWVAENDVFDEKGKKLGYFSGHEVYNMKGNKIAYVQNNKFYTSDGHSYHLDDVAEKIQGGSISDTASVAIRILIGD